jgi:hypothetical protein
MTMGSPAAGSPATPDDLSLTDHFRSFAAAAERDGGITYATICRGAADDPDLLALMDAAPPAQRRVNILLAATHFLLLDGAPHRLADYYDTVRLLHPGPVATPTDPPDRDLDADFRDFCLSHRDELLTLIAVRSTQTNEVGRCSALVPALALIAAAYPPGQPLSLLDLGTSAGLNLRFDRYGYTWRQDTTTEDPAEGLEITLGQPTPVELSCRVRSPLTGLPRLSFPPMADRAGLDLLPVDPTSEEGSRWLLACQWPDNLPRFSRLRAALQLAAIDPQPAVHQGDIVSDLPDVVATMEAEYPLIVFHSWVAAYLTPTGQGDLCRAIASLASTAGRPVHHLYAESPFDTPGLPTPASPVARPGPDLATALVHIAPDGAEPVRLADMHPHGTWLRWWGHPA